MAKEYKKAKAFKMKDVYIDCYCSKQQQHFQMRGNKKKDIEPEQSTTGNNCSCTIRDAKTHRDKAYIWAKEASVSARIGYYPGDGFKKEYKEWEPDPIMEPGYLRKRT